MEKFLDYIGSDLPKGHQIKNLLFARTEYSSAFLLQGHEFIPRKDGLPSPAHQPVQLSQLISAANPVLDHKRYFLKLLKYEDKETGASVWENPCNHLNDLVSLDKDGLTLKFAGFCAIEKRRLAQFDKIAILTTSGSIGTSSGASTQATKATVLTINSATIPAMSREDQNYYFFPETRSLPVSSVEITDYDLNADAATLGEISREVLEQRIDEANERLLLILNDRVLTHPSVASGKLSYDLVYEGFRYLNALMALKAVYTEILSKLYLGPIKGLKLYQTLGLELEVVEAFCNTCTSPSLLPSLKLVVKNVRLLVTNPKQSFMLHLFALVTSQQSTEHMGNTQTVLAIRDFMQKDYLIQVFSSLKHSVFKKVSKNWDLSVDEVNMAIDVMIAWSAVKTSSMGRFWKARLFNNLIANCLMAFYLREINKQPREDADQAGLGSKRAEVTLTTFVNDNSPKQGGSKQRTKPKDREDLGEESRAPVQRGPLLESEHNPTPEATNAGRFLFKEAQRYLQHRKSVVAFYARL